MLAAAVELCSAFGAPVVRQALSRSADHTCASNLRQIGRATALYMADHDGFFPFAYGQSDSTNWTDALAPFLFTRSNAAPDSVRSSAIFHCPADNTGPAPVSYATNALLSGARNNGRTHYAASIASVKDPAVVVWAGDTNKNWTRKEGYYDTIADWIRPEEDLGFTRTDDRAVAFYRTWLKDRDWTDIQTNAFDCPDGLYRCKYPAFRHGRSGDRSGSCTFVFVDGHARAFHWGALGIENFFPYPTPRQMALYGR